MRKLRLSTFFDGIFVFLLSFFLAYALIKGGIKKIAPTVILSVIISAVITFAFCLIMEKRGLNRDVLLKDKQEYDRFLRFLYFCSDGEILRLIKAYYSALDLKSVIKGKGVLIEENKSLTFFSFTPEKTDLKTILSAYKKTPKGYATHFIASEYDGSVYEFFKTFEKVKLFNGKDFYLCLKEHGLIPEKVYEIQTKKKVKIPLKQVFKRENSKRFFAFGAIFLLFSTITYYKWFYLILGTAFLIISCYLRFFKGFSKKEKAELL
ncbi:MAG: magnesium transporter [Clostridia bacterium]|nr:magnesium transporter [Clostridia bacterium]